jgi:hypothetical protein
MLIPYQELSASRLLSTLVSVEVTLLSTYGEPVPREIRFKIFKRLFGISSGKLILYVVLVNRSKAKGTTWESAIVTYLNKNGWPLVERRTLSGANDKGDIAGVTDWALEAKAEKQISLASYMTEAEVEAKNAKTRFFAAIVKRRGKGTSEGYVVMPLRVFVDLLGTINR